MNAVSHHLYVCQDKDVLITLAAITARVATDIDWTASPIDVKVRAQ